MWAPQKREARGCSFSPALHHHTHAHTRVALPWGGVGAALSPPPPQKTNTLKAHPPPPGLTGHAPPPPAWGAGVAPEHSHIHTHTKKSGSPLFFFGLVDLEKNFFLAFRLFSTPRLSTHKRAAGNPLLAVFFVGPLPVLMILHLCLLILVWVVRCPPPPPPRRAHVFCAAPPRRAPRGWGGVAHTHRGAWGADAAAPFFASASRYPQGGGGSGPSLHEPIFF